MSAAVDTCCGIRLDLVDVLKKEQKSLGLEGRLLLREAKKFSRHSLISLFEVRRRFLYISNKATEFLLYGVNIIKTINITHLYCFQASYRINTKVHIRQIPTNYLSLPSI